MKVILADGDHEIVKEIPYDVMRIRVPVMSRSGRCECTKPSIKSGEFCCQQYTRKEMRGDIPVFRIDPRAPAAKLTRTPWTLSYS